MSGGKKDNFWQAIRGICILAVIMIHCPNAALYGPGDMRFQTWFIIRQAINFPVATFVFLSGYFTNTKEAEIDYKKYLKIRGDRLLIPFLLWSAFYSTIDITKDILKGGCVDWLEIAIRIITGRASTPLYYILVLLQMTLLTPVLFRIVKAKGVAYRLLWLLTPSYLMCIYFSNINTGQIFDGYGTLFPAWFVFFYLGLNVQIHKDDWEKCAKRFGRWYYIFGALVLSILEGWLLLRLGCSRLATSQVKYSSFLYTGFFILLLFRKHMEGNKKLRENRILVLAGDCSYGVFYIHCFILMVVGKGCEFIGMSDGWLFHFIVCFVLTASASVGFVAFIQWLSSKSSILKKLAGLVGII